MTWLDDGHPAAALVGLLVGALLGWFVPWVLALLPEPEPDPEPEVPADLAGPGAESDADVATARPGLPPPPPKEPYAAIAALPGLAPRCALASALVAAVLAASTGWTGALLVLLPLAPVGVALALVDWRTTLLPTRIIAPAYAVTVVAVLAAGVLDGDRDAVVRAGWGWLTMGGVFVLLWLIYPRGLGYGDVRLSGVLGLALGYLGWSTLLVGLYGAFLIGGLGGALLGLLRIVDRKRFPFGPFMLVAALVGVAVGPLVGRGLGY
ncbi:MAG: peptidase prepilin type [Marmoricola sp.]|nr:peptidase prepilin type [Marmoricola sp.]